MRILLQRVKQASVTVDNKVLGEIQQGLLLLLGVHALDTEEGAVFLAEKCASLRIFPDEAGKMNRSVTEIGGAALVISQFTLYGDCRRGRRPSFSDAAAPEPARRLYEFFIARLQEQITEVQTGEFGAEMQVALINDGPVTLILEKD